MHKHKIGKGLLYFWLGFNLILAFGIIVSMLILKNNAPGISLIQTDAEIMNLPSNALATMNSLAMLMNGVIIAFCVQAIILLRYGVGEYRWAYYALVSSLFTIQFSGFASDRYLGNINWIMNLVSMLVMLLGVWFVKVDKL